VVDSLLSFEPLQRTSSCPLYCFPFYSSYERLSNLWTCSKTCREVPPFSILLIVPSTTPTLVGQVRVIPLDSFHFLYLERIILTSSPERCLASPSLTSNSNRKHGSQTRPLQNESRYTSDNVMTSGEQATSIQRATTTTLREGRLIQAIS
jgi:hypothetical protein